MVLEVILVVLGVVLVVLHGAQRQCSGQSLLENFERLVLAPPGSYRHQPLTKRRVSMSSIWSSGVLGVKNGE